MTNIIESFSIPIYEWKTVDAGQKTIRIKGVALRGDVVSKNNRKYTREALMKATNTWINKPINVNHDNTKNVGTIKWMDYDLTSDALLYEAEINREPYVTLLRNHSTEIRGLSVQADYLHTVCVKCGKKFYTEEDWYKHVTEEEFMRNMPTEPHGIIGSAISLVLSPEIPGYEGTTYELAEIHRQATLRLLETVIIEKIEEEKYKMSKIALNKETGNIAVGKSGIKGLAEQELLRHASKVKEQEEEHKCGEGEHWDKEKQECVKTESEPPAAIETLQLGEPCSPELKACVDKLIADGKEESSAWAICKSQLGETIKLRESKLGVVAWEPIKFEGFETVLKETKDEIRAAQIVKQNREINEAFKNMAFALNEIITEINKPLAVKMPYIDETWKSQVKQLTEAYKKITEYINALPKDDLGWKEIKPYDDIAIKAKLDELTQKIPKLEETITQQKKDFDNLLDSADKSVKEYFATTKKEMEADKTKIKELEEKLKQAENKKLEETENITTRVENLEDKLQPQFKSIAQKADKEKKASPDLTYKPGAK